MNNCVFGRTLFKKNSAYGRKGGGYEVEWAVALKIEPINK